MRVSPTDIVADCEFPAACKFGQSYAGFQPNGLCQNRQTCNQPARVAAAVLPTTLCLLSVQEPDEKLLGSGGRARASRRRVPVIYVRFADILNVGVGLTNGAGMGRALKTDGDLVTL